MATTVGEGRPRSLATSPHVRVVPCGSASTRSTRCPLSSAATARHTAVVLFPTPPVVAVAQQPLDGKLVIVGLGLNAQLYAYKQLAAESTNPGWSGYVALPLLANGDGVAVASQPALVALTDGRLAVFVRGTNS